MFDVKCFTQFSSNKDLNPLHRCVLMLGPGEYHSITVNPDGLINCAGSRLFYISK